MQKSLLMHKEHYFSDMLSLDHGTKMSVSQSVGMQNRKWQANDGLVRNRVLSMY